MGLMQAGLTSGAEKCKETHDIEGLIKKYSVLLRQRGPGSWPFFQNLIAKALTDEWGSSINDEIVSITTVLGQAAVAKLSVLDFCGFGLNVFILRFGGVAILMAHFKNFSACSSMNIF
jgi:hypothetical protein